MIPRTADDEVGRRFFRPRDLWANAGVTGLQLPVPQRRVVLAYGIVEQRLPGVIEGVVHRIDPGHVRTKAYLACHVHGHVYAEVGVKGRATATRLHRHSP